MIKKIIIVFLLTIFFSPLWAGAALPKFVILPNVYQSYVDQGKFDREVIELVKKTLSIHAGSPYQAVRIRLLYDKRAELKALIVALLSTQYKSVEFIRINVDNKLTVTSVMDNYHLQESDVMQSPAYNHTRIPVCPDDRVQFVIGNNFHGDASVEKVIQRIYHLAKERGYNPVLMDINDSSTQAPTVKAYEDWLSCPNVKGFYNESHGWKNGIVLSDDDFVYSLIAKDLNNKFINNILLFDSCETFRNPLLKAVIAPEIGHVQQYVAGYISLPFGPSERTASCIWTRAFDHYALDQRLINDCARENHLPRDAFQMAGNGDNHLLLPTIM